MLIVLGHLLVLGLGLVAALLRFRFVQKAGNGILQLGHQAFLLAVAVFAGVALVSAVALGVRFRLAVFRLTAVFIAADRVAAGRIVARALLTIGILGGFATLGSIFRTRAAGLLHRLLDRLIERVRIARLRAIRLRLEAKLRQKVIGLFAPRALRAFTSGYDLFHPQETIVWHDYGRPAAPKHWGDHTADTEGKTGRVWHELDSRSKDKVRRLLAGLPVESYGLGAARSLAEYEAYAGVSFKLRKAQDYTVRGGEPPNPETAEDWAGQIFRWMVRISFDRTALPAAAFDDPEFWYVGVKDESGAEIYRQDIPQPQVAKLPDGETTIVLVCEFESGAIPTTWTVWPMSRSLGWLKRIEGTLGDEDYTIVLEDGVE